MVRTSLQEQRIAYTELFHNTGKLNNGNLTDALKRKPIVRINTTQHNTAQKMYQSIVQTFSIPKSIITTRVKELKKIITDVNTSDADGKTLLIKACIDNRQDIVCYLLDEFSKDLKINKVDNKGNTALHYACRLGRPSIVQKLIIAMRAPVLDLSMQNDKGLTPLDVAMGIGSQSSVEIIVEEGIVFFYLFFIHSCT